MGKHSSTLGILTAFLLPAAAIAADLPVKAPPPAVVVDRYWVSAEFLYWQLKAQNVPAPLVATTDRIVGFGNDDFVTGAFTPLFGPGSFSDKWAPGGRLSAGVWINPTLAVEASGFTIGKISDGRSFSSLNPSSFLGIPFLLQDGSTSALVIGVPPALPGGAGVTMPGTINIDSSTRLWGVDTNLVSKTYQSGALKVEGLGGFRYLSLDDTFGMSTSSSTTAPSNIFFQPSGFVRGASIQTLDSFATQNQFFGGQVGLRTTYASGPFSLGLTGKFAFGAVREEVNASGNTLATNAAGTVLGNLGRGVLVMPNNSGSRSQTVFAVVPELQAKVGYAFTQRVTAFVGYDVLYISEVARAAGQVDNHTDTRLQPRNANFNAAFQTNVPSNRINSTSFWAHGVNVGLKASF